MEKFNQRLKKAMKMRNISQNELCQLTNIPKSAMSQYMSGVFKPKSDRLAVIAEALEDSANAYASYRVSAPKS